jgi:hypothetical protein
MMIPSDDTTDETIQIIRERLQQRVGDLQIAVQRVEALHREASGKIKPVISRIKA